MALQQYSQNLPINFNANNFLSALKSAPTCRHQKRNGLQTSCNDVYCNRGVMPKFHRTIERMSPTKIRMIVDIELEPQ